LFGTVLGLARAFFARGTGLGLEAPQVLASGLATALFTTIGGLIVFLFGQGFLILFREWLAYCERDVDRLVEAEEAT
jgi:biopolymer transport protein ExbB/TolQ